ncbi:MAG: dethiobiotin synthase, partial [Planctomycetaceae bacterium]
PVCTGAEDDRNPVSSKTPGFRPQVIPETRFSEKPGFEAVWTDIETLFDALGGEFERERIGPQRFLAPAAPPVAARREGRTVDARRLREGADWWRGRVEMLLVEGVGGLLCPLTETETVAGLAGDLGFPLLIVGRLGLGTINHVLLTIEAAQRRRLPIAGIVLNQSTPEQPGPVAESNPAEIAARCRVPVLGTLPFMSPNLLQAGRPITMDWMELSRAVSRE